MAINLWMRRRLNSLLTEVGITNANLWKHTVLYHTHDMKHEGHELYVAQIHRISKMNVRMFPN